MVSKEPWPPPEQELKQSSTGWGTDLGGHLSHRRLLAARSGRGGRETCPRPDTWHSLKAFKQAGSQRLAWGLAEQHSWGESHPEQRWGVEPPAVSVLGVLSPEQYLWVLSPQRNP